MNHALNLIVLGRVRFLESSRVIVNATGLHCCPHREITEPRCCLHEHIYFSLRYFLFYELRSSRIPQTVQKVVLTEIERISRTEFKSVWLKANMSLSAGKTLIPLPSSALLTSFFPRTSLIRRLPR